MLTDVSYELNARIVTETSNASLGFAIGAIVSHRTTVVQALEKNK